MASDLRARALLHTGLATGTALLALPGLVAGLPVMAAPIPVLPQPDQRASLAAFEAHLAAHASATEALARWCAARGIVPPGPDGALPPISAERLGGPPAPLPADWRAALHLAPGEEPGYRHVRLSCGGVVLSEAHNWYARSRLTPAMNTTLDSTDTPFGRVAAPLGFSRAPLLTRAGRDRACPAGTVSSHRALLSLPDGRPLALVEECYTPAVLAVHR